MEYEKKVFCSNITRVGFEQKNNLQDLLNSTPAIPIPVKIKENETCTFQPRRDNNYVTKKESRMKVRTVREIRNQFERDHYNFIIEDTAKQQRLLLTKIKTGSVTEDSTKNMAKTLLTADHPISRTTWQMLKNINPDKYINPTQFVLWNGRRISVVGSRGGKNKYIYNRDLGKNNIKDIKKECVLEKTIKKKQKTIRSGLLRNSLNIKFKPGPLQRKIHLDYSNQRYHMGPVELVKLPKPTLDIQPAYGTIVEPVMSNFLNNLRAENGTITEKWAEFAVSVLGTLKNKCVVQIDTECNVTFNLNYKCCQDRILMRRDTGNISINSDCATRTKQNFKCESDNMLEIQQTLDKILDSVEISIKQDYMYSIENLSPLTIPDPLQDSNTNNVKYKSKKKYGELDRLAVTVIQLPLKEEQKPLKFCGKSYCTLGCICDSLNCTYTFKQHCGCLECMFGCKCKLFKYKNNELLENDCAELIPGLMKMDNEINANLAKEEQKFHQTVVVSGEKSILLKSRKRTSKSSMKYAEFYRNMRLKSEKKPKKILTIVGTKLDCANIEPWCMVHNLYKCFCKGRFTESSAFNTSLSLPTTNISADPESSNSCAQETVNHNREIRNVLRPRRVHQSRKSICLIEDNILRDCDGNFSDYSAARTKEYAGRQYDISYYKSTNNKILEMEKNDKNLQKKLMRLTKDISLTLSPKPTGTTPIILADDSDDTSFGYINRNDCLKKTNKKSAINKNNPSLTAHKADPIPQKNLSKLDSTNNSENSKTSSTELYIPFEISGDIYKPIKDNQITQEFLTPWIAKSYKSYKAQLISGKSVLERPKRGKIILHLWEYLLMRYRSGKNIIMTTTKRPFRIYIATDIEKPFFKDCISINTIRFVDLHKYPCVIKKLLTNASNKDYFCILGGWDDGWEIIGSVKKNNSSTDDLPNDSNISNTESITFDSDFEQNNWVVNKQDKMTNGPNVDCLQKTNTIELQKNKNRSKWFLITLENDFTEMYCYKKGFFVEREKIQNAIDLARVTHKTIVINKQTCAEITDIPFGIYALPDTTEYCAVVGPYEIDESLGLELVKVNMLNTGNSTKGYWITTNKVDNIKVLDDPLSFLLSKTAHNKLRNKVPVNAFNSMDVGDDFDNNRPSTSQVTEKNTKIIHNEDGLNKCKVVKKQILPRLVKPIKIRRTNGFYHLTSNNNFVKKSLPNTATLLLDANRLEIKTQIQNNDLRSLLSIPNHVNAQIMNLYEDDKTIACNGAELPQIKITSVYSESDNTIDKNKDNNKKPGMFILKPEEINKKVSESDYEIKFLADDYEMETDVMSMDIENFLSSSGECGSYENTLENSIILISDEEEDNDDVKHTQKWTDVWIRSPIKNLGCIRARRNEDNLLSIDFPGIKPMTLYNEIEAFDIINQVLSSTISIPENMNIKWQVVTQTSKCEKRGLLNLKSLANKYEISEKGLVKSCKKNKRIKSNESSAHTSPLHEDPSNVILNTSSDLIDGLEETSRLLEDQRILLWNETEKRQTEIIKTINVPEQLKPEMSATLQGLMTMNDDLVDDREVVS